MENFAKLVDALYFLNSNNAKADLIIQFLNETPDPDRGWAIAAIAGTLEFEFFKRKTVKDLIVERIDPVLFDLSYDYVGEMSETVAHLWSITHAKEPKADFAIPTLSEVVSNFSTLPKTKIRPYLIELMDHMSPPQRWALLKLGTRGLRIGVSARFLKKILAKFAQVHGQDIQVEDIEQVWHGVTPPYTNMLAWLEGKGDQPKLDDKLTFQPVMLAHPIDDDTLKLIKPDTWQAEWKFDGIRAQLLSSEHGTALYSRTGDDISHSFPDLIDKVNKLAVHGRFDGELLALQAGDSNANAIIDEQQFSRIGSFNQLQQRLNKKKPSNKLIADIPVGLVVYDLLKLGKNDLRQSSLIERYSALRTLFSSGVLNGQSALLFSEPLTFNDYEDLVATKEKASKLANGYVEGLMIKHKQSIYVAGRPKGQWYKLKRDPKLVDAVIMYAQRGHGKRSSFYSDFTFGCWQDGVLLPIGKAYSGFTDDELKRLDTWVRRNAIGRFGPVKEVKKELVVEVAFDAVQNSKRHKSKLALRFPRIHRIRWDKPANEADQLNTLIDMIS